MVSIITPVYNSEAHIEECINSVLSQSLSEWELLLIDDYSSDSSISIIKKYAQSDPRIKFYLFKKNVGAGIARNKGIEISKNRFIAFLDSDDYWHEDKLKLQINFMLKNKIEFSYSYFYELNKSDQVKKIITAPKKIDLSKLLFNNYIKTLTAIYDTKRIGKIYMPDYRKRQDWGLWFNILKKVKNAYCLQRPLSYYRTSNSSLSKNKVLLLRENFNFYKNFMKKNSIISFLMMFLFLFFYFMNKVFGHKKIKK